LPCGFAFGAALALPPFAKPLHRGGALFLNGADGGRNLPTRQTAAQTSQPVGEQGVKGGGFRVEAACCPV
jgi:hypothetical protein